MDPVERVAWLGAFVLALLFALVPRAHAYGTVDVGAGDAVPRYQWYPGGVPSTPPVYFTAASTAAACAAMLALHDSYTVQTACFLAGDVQWAGDHQQPGNWYSVSGKGVYVGMVAGPPSCPANSTAVGSSCTCNSGYAPNLGGDACESYTCSAGSVYQGVEAFKVTSGQVSGQCVEGCLVSGSMASQGADGQWWLSGPFVQSTTICEGAGGSGSSLPDQASTPVPSPCAAGTCPGTVNGQQVCAACSQQTAPGPSSSASGPAGSSSSTSVTTCSGTGSCTTTTTTTNSSGTTVTNSTSSGGLGGFCAENPGSAICQSASWGGACAGGFSCNGDAVQCAMAREQHRRNCQLFETPTPESVQGEALIAEGAASGVRYSQSEVDIGARFTAAEVNPFSNACPPDLPLGVGDLVVPLSNYCGTLEMLGRILVALTWISAAAWLVSKGV